MRRKTYNKKARSNNSRKYNSSSRGKINIFKIMSLLPIKNKFLRGIVCVVILAVLAVSHFDIGGSGTQALLENVTEQLVAQFEGVPSYDEEGFTIVNENEPYFTDEEMTDESFEEYSELDDLGRCGLVIASIGKDIMPTKKRESISSVKPTGWQTAWYENVDGEYLYNRSHLIGFQLTGENANERNLITGTRYMNATTMLQFENMVADYVKETGNHVYYRVTPVFEEDNLVASGVLMEAKSVEDDGEGICFNVFCHNIQPDIEIDYATGDSWDA